MRPNYYVSTDGISAPYKSTPTQGELNLKISSDLLTQRKVMDPVVRYLADHGGRVNERDKYGITPLHYAAMRGR